MGRAVRRTDGRGSSTDIGPKRLGARALIYRLFAAVGRALGGPISRVERNWCINSNRYPTARGSFGCGPVAFLGTGVGTHMLKLKLIRTIDKLERHTQVVRATITA